MTGNSASKKRSGRKKKARPPPPQVTLTATTLIAYEAIASAVPAAALRAMRARRALTDQAATEKLSLLRRLELQKVLGELPETRVEQSFNEQLFARVLDYRTLLSHGDGTAFHLVPKNLLTPGKLDDFSLGFFGTTPPSKVLATAEFKSPGTDLDKPQTSGDYGGITPVAQAFAAAAGHATCRWALVSNFRELRLYAIDGPMLGRLLAGADLLRVRTRDDLALLCAHFDRRALLGDGEKEESEMTTALADASPARGFDPVSNRYRIQWLYTPALTSPLALHRIETKLRQAVERSEFVSWFLSPRSPDPRNLHKIDITIETGWLVISGRSLDRSSPVTETRIAVSRFGQVVMSMREPRCPPSGTTVQYIEPGHLDPRAAFFGRIVNFVHGNTLNKGEIELVLSEVGGLQWKHEACTAVGDEIAGRALAEKTHPAIIAEALAHAMADVAIQFRDASGGVVLDPAQLGAQLAAAMGREA